MKKLFSIFALFIVIGASEMKAQKYPFGAATYTTVTLTTKQTTYTYTATNTLTELDFGTLDTTLALTVVGSSKIGAGAQLIVKSKSDGTIRTITPNTSYFISGTIVGVASHTIVCCFRYNGTKWEKMSAAVQID